MRAILIGGVAIVGVVGATMLMEIGGIKWSGFLGKLWEQERYEIHKESQTYRDGMQNTLSDLMREYERADTVGKIGIKETIRHQFSQVDTSRFPAYQQDFLRTELGIY